MNNENDDRDIDDENDGYNDPKKMIFTVKINNTEQLQDFFYHRRIIIILLVIVII